MSECGGVWRRIAGKLENLLCVMARTLCLRITFPTFWHFVAWTTNSKFQRETKEFTWQDKRLASNSLSTFDSQIYVAFLTLWDTLSSHSTELQNLITGGTDRESISWSHMRFKSLPQQYSRCTVIQCRDVKTRAKVKHTLTKLLVFIVMLWWSILWLNKLLHWLWHLLAGSFRSQGRFCNSSHGFLHTSLWIALQRATYRRKKVHFLYLRA